MNLVDVHAHLDFPEFEDLKPFISRAEEAGVKKIIANGVNPKSNRKVLELSKKYDLVNPALGLYPDDIYTFSLEELNQEINWIKKNKPVAFGEVGLDHKFLADEKKIDWKKSLQKQIFQRFIEISEKTKKPLIIHSRKAEKEVLDMLDSSNVKNPILHCFMGKKKLVKRAADSGYIFSVLPIVDRLQQIRELVKYTNINQLLTETDAPYMSPNEKINEPANVMVAVKEIAKLKGFDVEETANSIFMNYKKIFK